jgi:UDPglucose--hexose-1-phosphate uridylyltransferase
VHDDGVIRDALTGDAVIVATHRQERPNRPADGCPFCVGGLEAPGPYETRWFPNRWPSFADGRSEVHLFSPEHDATLATMGREHVRKVVDLWAERTAALGGRPDVVYVLLFENSGRDAGATIAHPHGQAFGYAEIPDRPAQELVRDDCSLCTEPPADLVVAAAGNWLAWIPEAATSPFELRLAPRDHVADLPGLDERGRDDCAALLSDALGCLDRVVARPMPRMLWAHQRPFDGGAWPNAHLHFHVHALLRNAHSLRYVSGGELGGGVFINPVAPSSAAEALRSC